MQRWSPEVIRYLHTAADRSRYYTDLARELGRSCTRRTGCATPGAAWVC